MIEQHWSVSVSNLARLRQVTDPQTIYLALQDLGNSHQTHNYFILSKIARLIQRRFSNHFQNNLPFVQSYLKLLYHQFSKYVKSNLSRSTFVRQTRFAKLVRHLPPIELQKLLLQNFNYKGLVLVMWTFWKNKWQLKLQALQSKIFQEIKQHFFQQLKFQNSKTFEWNKAFSLLVSQQSFQKLFQPQLLRLSRRSQNNLSITQQFVGNLADDFKTDMMLGMLNELKRFVQSEQCSVLGRIAMQIAVRLSKQRLDCLIEVVSIFQNCKEQDKQNLSFTMLEILTKLGPKLDIHLFQKIVIKVLDMAKYVAGCPSLQALDLWLQFISKKDQLSPQTVKRIGLAFKQSNFNQLIAVSISMHFSLFRQQVQNLLKNLKANRSRIFQCPQIYFKCCIVLMDQTLAQQIYDKKFIFYSKQYLTEWNITTPSLLQLVLGCCQYEQIDQQLMGSVVLRLCSFKEMKKSQLERKLRKGRRIELLIRGLYSYLWFEEGETVGVKRSRVNYLTGLAIKISNNIQLSQQIKFKLTTIGLSQKVSNKLYPKIIKQQIQVQSAHLFNLLGSFQLLRDPGLFRCTLLTPLQKDLLAYAEPFSRIQNYDVANKQIILNHLQKYQNDWFLDCQKQQIRIATQLDLVTKLMQKQKQETFTTLLQEHQYKMKMQRDHHLFMFKRFSKIIRIFYYFLQQKQSLNNLIVLFQPITHLLVFTQLKKIILDFVSSIIKCSKFSFISCHHTTLFEFYYKKSMDQPVCDYQLDRLANLLDAVLSGKQVQRWVLVIVQQMSVFILQSQNFDIKIKRKAIQYFLKHQNQVHSNQLSVVFQSIVKSLGALHNLQETSAFLTMALQKVPKQMISVMLNDLLNLPRMAQLLVLKKLLEIKRKDYNPNFQQLVKLNIAQNSESLQVKTIAVLVLELFQNKLTSQKIDINLVKFVKQHSKEVIDKFARLTKKLIKQQKSLKNPLFQKCHQCAQILYDQNFDQEGLTFYLSFLQNNADQLQQSVNIRAIKLLVQKYASNPQLVALVQNSIRTGVVLIRSNSKYVDSIVNMLASFIDSKKGSPSSNLLAIILLGTSAQFAQNSKALQGVQKKILAAFQTGSEQQQRSIAKCMPELMSFFKKAEQLIKQGLARLPSLKQLGSRRSQCYQIAGLCKGLGNATIQKFGILSYIRKDYQSTKDITQRHTKALLLKAFSELFGRYLQINLSQVKQIILLIISDPNQEVRKAGLKSAEIVISKLSSLGVKRMLPLLIQGLELEDISWRAKVGYIWMLGHLAHCSAKQLQACLPQIVPVLSRSLSDTDSGIRSQAADSLQLIGTSIKNPQISQNVDLLIKALSDPFDSSKHGLEVLLRTRFVHYLDLSALSLIVPIVDYSLRGRNPQLKMAACQVVGALPGLIQNPLEIIPYIPFLADGIKSACSETVLQIRKLASKAIGRLSIKIGVKKTFQLMVFIEQFLKGSNSTPMQRLGAANALAQIICSHQIQFFQQKLNQIFQKITSSKGPIKEGYLNVLVHLPGLLKQNFQPYIKQVITHVYQIVSQQQESLRSIAQQIMQTLINKFGLQQKQLFMSTLKQGIFDNIWRRRNSATSLVGNMLEVFRKNPNGNQQLQNQGLMLIYTLRTDEIQMVRYTANQIWSNFVQNTIRVLKKGFRALLNVWGQGIYKASGVIQRSLFSFIPKYGQTFFQQLLSLTSQLLESQKNCKGLFEVFKEFIKKLSNQTLLKYSSWIVENFDKAMRSDKKIVSELVQSICLYCQKLRDISYLRKNIFPFIDQQDSQQSSQSDQKLQLIGQFCKSKSPQISTALINFIVRPPLGMFRLQILIKNSNILAHRLFDLKIQQIQSFVYFLQQMCREAPGIRLQSLVYCLKQLSISLKQDQRIIYLQQLCEMLNKLADSLLQNPYEKDMESVFRLLEVFHFFIRNITQQDIASLNDFVRKLVPLAFLDNSQLKSKLNEVINFLFSINNRKKLSQFFQQFASTIESYMIVKNFQGTLAIWNNQESAQTYLNIILKAITNLGPDLFQSSITLLTLFIKLGPESYLQNPSIKHKIIGCLLRSSGFRLQIKQRMLLQKSILQFLQIFNIDIFVVQLTYSQVMVLRQYKNNQFIIDSTIKIICALYKKTSRFSHIIPYLLSKVDQIGIPALTVLSSVLAEGLQHGIITKSHSQEIHKLAKEIATKNMGQPTICLALCSFAAQTGCNWQQNVSSIKSLAPNFSEVLLYLQTALHNRKQVQQFATIKRFLKDANKQQTVSLLRCIVPLSERQEQVRKQLSKNMLQSLISQTIIGFEEIEEQLKQLS